MRKNLLLSAVILSSPFWLTACGGDSDSTDTISENDPLTDDIVPDEEEPVGPHTLSFNYLPSLDKNVQLYVAAKLDDVWTVYNDLADIIVPDEQTVTIVSTCTNTVSGYQFGTAVYQLTPVEDMDLGNLDCGLSGVDVRALRVESQRAGDMVIANSFESTGYYHLGYFLDPYVLSENVPALSITEDDNTGTEYIFKTLLDISELDGWDLNIDLNIDLSTTQETTTADKVNANIEVLYRMPNSDDAMELDRSGDVFVQIPAELRTEGDMFEMRYSLFASNVVEEGSEETRTDFSVFASEADTDIAQSDNQLNLPSRIAMSQDELSFTLDGELISDDEEHDLQFIQFLFNGAVYYTDMVTYSRDWNVQVVDLNELPEHSWTYAPQTPAVQNGMTIKYCYANRFMACLEPVAGDAVRLEERRFMSMHDEEFF
ncbi:MAG: hypothetical protein CMI03_06720 [Oceanospirillaceae bacterium]|uniref:hypothetical protein n=1 Tax=Thalassolituus sp. UBA6592 TaxID=1947665 RepID=UPI000C3ED186|nr:hypothetical protein [Thalassolituus sp. UBA6592]MBS52424.1 hypothetical protein [Oceanospirillaceae bacterium]|tara:strand:+ start:2732 stop:4018 length:1287 start_codon:yes stop_codon:yes gene_type:complete